MKQALRELLPAEVLDRRKMGFAIPLAHWFRGELKEVFEARVFAQDAFIQDFLHPEIVRQWWAQHQRGTRDYSAHLWALLMLECWGARFARAGV